MNIFELTTEQWIELGTSLIIILVTAVVGGWLIRFLLKRVLHRLFERTRTNLDNVVLDTLQTPLYFLAITIATDLAIQRLDFLSQSWSGFLDTLFYVIYFLIGFIALWRLTVALFEWYGQEVAPSTETELDEQLIPFFSRVSLIVLGVIGLIILLSHFRVDVSALVTTLGVGSLAIALAAQAALSDTISGFIIMIDRPFRIGDRIELLDLDTWGDVVDIGLRSSRIRTRDNRMVIVPNSVIGKTLIVNHSYPDEMYRLEVNVGVAYGTDIHAARQTIVGAVKKVEGVEADYPVEALFLEFGDSALVFRVRWWLNSYVDTRRMFDKVNTAMYDALGEAGIEIPFPQRDVNHKIDDDQARQLAGVFNVRR